jgi:hypothetical protein
MSKIVKLITKVVTGRVRFNYVSIFQPRTVAEGEEAKYSLQILIPKTDKELVSKIEAVLEEAKKEGAALWGGAVPADLKTPLKDGDLEELGEEYRGHYYINLSAKSRPMAVDRQLMEIKDQSEIYSGCYGRISFNLYVYNHGNGMEVGKGFNRGIGCGLLNVQKLSDVEPLGRTRPEDDFDAVEEEEDILS